MGKEDKLFEIKLEIQLSPPPPSFEKNLETKIYKSKKKKDAMYNTDMKEKDQVRQKDSVFFQCQ